MTPHRRRPCSRELAPVAPMKNPSRERLKTELKFLRSQVGALEAELLEHQCHVGNHGTAAHQDALDRRRASERENRRLRALLWRQIRSGRHSIAALTGQTPEMLGAGPLFSLAPLAVRHASQLHDDHGQRFALLLNEVDRAFTYLDEVFGEPNATVPCGSHGTFTTALQSRVFGQRDQQLVLESRNSDVIPFDLARSGTALWDAIEPAAFGPGDAVVRSASTDIKIARLRTCHTLDGVVVEVTVSFVVKRFLTNDRTVVVWRTVTTSDASDCDAFIDETGWTMYTREEASAESERGTEATRKRSCVQWVPRAIPDARGRDDRAVALAPKTRALTKLVLSSWANEVVSINELMENLLIDDCMRATESPNPAKCTVSDNSASASANRIPDSITGHRTTEFSLAASPSCRETEYSSAALQPTQL